MSLSTEKLSPGGVTTPPVYRRDQKTLDPLDPQGLPYCKKVVVAVHGMGDQTRNDMVQTVAGLFARHAARPGGRTAQGVPHQATKLPLTLWGDGGSPREDDVVGFVPAGEDPWLGQFGFAEVYWAHIPRQFAGEKYRLEESKKWAASVVERLGQRHRVAAGFMPDGPQLAATVLEEIAESLRILDRVLALGKAAGFTKVNTANVLTEYLGDVQQVADSQAQRTLIVREFLLRMQHIAAECPDTAEIHLVAHSEGTVVALLGLLNALHAETPADWKKEQARRVAKGIQPGLPDLDLSWIRRVRSFTTLGSPVDKHLHLWPEMWFRFTPVGGNKWSAHMVPGQIRWRNYYDLADPVGYDLDTARQQVLGDWGCTAFAFDPGHDHGFRRYPLPGVAHVDYFGDDELFSHIIQQVVDPVPGQPAPAGAGQGPPDRWYGWVSQGLPFVVVGGIFLVAVFLLLRALGGEAGVGGNEVDEAAGAHGGGLGLWAVLGSAALLYGTVVLARVPHIRGQGTLGAWAIFALGVVVHLLAGWWGERGTPPVEVAFSWRSASSWPWPWAELGMTVLALAVVGIAVAADRRAVKQRRSPVWGLRLLMLLGFLPVTLLLLGAHLLASSAEVEPLSLLLAGGLFLYLTWLGILLFDLAYVWKTYINTTRSKTFLAKLRGANGKYAPPPAPG